MDGILVPTHIVYSFQFNKKRALQPQTHLKSYFSLQVHLIWLAPQLKSLQPRGTQYTFSRLPSATDFCTTCSYYNHYICVCFVCASITSRATLTTSEFFFSHARQNQQPWLCSGPCDLHLFGYTRLTLEINTISTKTHFGIAHGIPFQECIWMHENEAPADLNANISAIRRQQGVE